MKQITTRDMFLAVIIILSFVSFIALAVNKANANEWKTVVRTTEVHPIYFEQGKSVVRNKSSIRKLELSGVQVKVVGYASSEGSREYNARLSTARAMAVSRILSVDAEIDSHGEGVARKVPYHKDRRVDIMATREAITYTPVFGGYTEVLGPVHHLQWNTLPR